MENLFNEFEAKSLKDWNHKIISDLKGKAYEDLLWNSPEGILVHPIYHNESITSIGSTITHTHSDWEIEQTLIKPKNKDVLDCLNQGATAVYLKDINAESITTTLEKVLIEHIQTSISSNDLLGCVSGLNSIINERGLDKDNIRGSLRFDPLIQGLIDGEFPTVLWENATQVVDKTIGLPKFQSITIAGHNYTNAGANLVQELAYTLAQASEYFANLNNLSPSSIQISLGISTNYFFEIAKHRAIRILWSQLIESYEFEPSLLQLRSETSERSATIYDPHVNMLRATSQCMSAALGGSNTINVHSFNAAYKQEDPFAQRMSRNISLILKEEAYFNKVSDPASGSYYIESLTNTLCKEAWEVFKDIEAKGGWIASVQEGYLQEQIKLNAVKQEARLNTGDISLLGTNLYPNTEELMGDRVEKPTTNIIEETKSFKALEIKRLSEKMDVERLENEKSHV